MSGDDIAGFTFLGIILLGISLVMYMVFTDEYSVDRVSECVESKYIYTCGIDNGSTLYRCETVEECNEKCEKERNK